MAGLKSWPDQGKAIPNRQSIHVAPAGAKIQNRYNLVQGFRAQRPEVPHGVGILAVGLGIALLGVNEIKELQRIANEENRRIVAG